MLIQLEVSDIEWKRFESFAHANSYSLEKAIARKLKFPVTKVTVGATKIPVAEGTIEAKVPGIEISKVIKKQIPKRKPGRPKK